MTQFWSLFLTVGQEVGRYLNIILRSIRTLDIDKNEKNWDIIYWKNFSQSLYDPSLFILTLTNQSRVHLQIEQQKSVMCFCGFFWSKSRFGDTKSRIKPNQTLSIKLKTLHVIIVKKFLVEAAFRIKIMYQLFMKALWFLELFALKGNLVANIKNVQKD